MTLQKYFLSIVFFSCMVSVWSVLLVFGKTVFDRDFPKCLDPKKILPVCWLWWSSPAIFSQAIYNSISFLSWALRSALGEAYDLPKLFEHETWPGHQYVFLDSPLYRGAFSKPLLCKVILSPASPACLLFSWTLIIFCLRRQQCSIIFQYFWETPSV